MSRKHLFGLSLIQQSLKHESSSGLQGIGKPDTFLARRPSGATALASTRLVPCGEFLKQVPDVVNTVLTSVYTGLPKK